MLITISGHSGVGKSTTAERLAKKLRAKVVDTGNFFRDQAKKRGLNVVEFGRYVEKHPEVDRRLDDDMLALAAKTPRLILLGRLTGWMTYRRQVPAIRIWMSATPKIRAQRVIKREGGDYATVYKDLMTRDRDNIRRYRQLYGLDLNDLGIYDIVCPTDNLNLNQVVALLFREVSKLWLKKRQKRLSRPPRKAPRRRKPKA